MYVCELYASARLCSVVLLAEEQGEKCLTVGGQQVELQPVAHCIATILKASVCLMDARRFFFK